MTIVYPPLEPSDPFEYPPLDPEPFPAPVSPAIPLNPPMVGFATPFDHVDGTNRDLILEGIRTWARNNLRVWSKAWQDYIEAWVGTNQEWLAGFKDALTLYLGEQLEEFADWVEDVIAEAVDWIVNATIEVSDPVIFGIVSNPATNSSKYLRSELLEATTFRFVGTPSETSVALDAALAAAATGKGNGIVVIPPGSTVIFREPLGGAGVSWSNVELCILGTLKQDNPAEELFFRTDGSKNFRITGPGTIDMGGRTRTGNPDNPADPARVEPIKRMIVRDAYNFQCSDIEFINLSSRTFDFQGSATGTNGQVGTQKVLIERCKFGPVWDIGIWASTGWDVGAMLRDITIRSCSFENVQKWNPTGPWTHTYMKVNGAYIEDNVVAGSVDTAFMFGFDSLNVWVSGNVITTRQVCVFMGGVFNWHVFENTMTSTNDIGVAGYDTETSTRLGGGFVHHNRFVDCAKPGVFIEGMDYITVSDNIFIGCGWRADYWQAQTGNDRYNCVIGVQGPGSPLGIIITNNSIQRGDFVAATFYAISVRDAPVGCTVNDNSVPGGTTAYTQKFIYGTPSSSNKFQRDTSPYLYAMTTGQTTIDGTAGYERIQCAQTAATTIGLISSALSPGATMYLYSVTSNITVKQNGTAGATVRLKGGVDAVIPQYGILTLRFESNAWVEQARSWE